MRVLAGDGGGASAGHTHMAHTTQRLPGRAGDPASRRTVAGIASAAYRRSRCVVCAICVCVVCACAMCVRKVCVRCVCVCERERERERKREREKERERERECVCVCVCVIFNT